MSDSESDSNSSSSSYPSSSSSSEEEKDDEIQLNDGLAPVKDIVILSLFRNNAAYIRDYLLPRFEILEELYDVNFRYFFIENNSTDDTSQLLDKFVSTRSCKSQLVTLDLPDFANMGINYERTARLAMIRNKILDVARESGAIEESQWCLLVDSDICFDVNALAQLFAKKPRANGVGMLSSFTVEALYGRQVNMHEQYKHCKDDEVVTMGHYADTFALMTVDSHNYRPKCPFSSCKMCKLDLYSKEGHADGLFDVRSCYNGFCIIDSEILRNKDVQWGTFHIMDLQGRHSLCEHVLFCHSLRAASGKRVCVAMDVDQVFWTNP